VLKKCSFSEERGNDMRRGYAENERLLAAFMRYHRTVDLIKETGLSKSTILKLKKDPAFQNALSERRTQVVAAAADRLRSYICTDIDTLQAIADDQDIQPQVRINAIQCILGSFSTLCGIAEIERRLTALESKSGR
jgi:hypothetical protein